MRLYYPFFIENLNFMTENWRPICLKKKTYVIYKNLLYIDNLCPLCPLCTHNDTSRYISEHNISNHVFISYLKKKVYLTFISNSADFHWILLNDHLLYLFVCSFCFEEAAKIADVWKCYCSTELLCILNDLSIKWRYCSYIGDYKFGYFAYDCIIALFSEFESCFL